MNAEQQRLTENNSPEESWHFWGPYLAERAWGTVREDYSGNGDAWNYFPHDHARSRVYRWNEDGIAGICDYKQRLCLGFAFWNEHDPFLKERFFGLTGPQGNHGEDVKEVYWYGDSTPTHSYMSMLYRYPQARFPYEELIAQSGARSKMESEFEIWDTSALANNRFFDIKIEYAKASPYDILIRATATNCGPEPTTLHLLPLIWFRNTWSWGRDNRKPNLQERGEDNSDVEIIEATHPDIGTYRLHIEGAERLLFSENESNLERLWGVPNTSPFAKDSINDAIVHGKIGAVNPNQVGTKAAADYKFTISPNESCAVRLRLTKIDTPGRAREARALPGVDSRGAFSDFDAIFAARKAEGDEFYAQLAPSNLSEEHRAIQRQAFAGLLWNKQFYHYIVEQWLDGDPGQPLAPNERQFGRNSEWRHVYNERVMSMPDKWEFPWYASWDLAFHCIPLALVDVQFAKRQLDLIGTRMVSAPERTDSGLRVEFQRREPASFSLGGLASFSNRAETKRQRRSRIFGNDFPQNAHRLYLVGESQGLRGQQHLSRRLSRARQYRRLRSKRLFPGRFSPRAKRWHELDGNALPQPHANRD